MLLVRTGYTATAYADGLAVNLFGALGGADSIVGSVEKATDAAAQKLTGRGCGASFSDTVTSRRQNIARLWVTGCQRAQVFRRVPNLVRISHVVTINLVEKPPTGVRSLLR